jgi:hypothetical protein
VLVALVCNGVNNYSCTDGDETAATTLLGELCRQLEQLANAQLQSYATESRVYSGEENAERMPPDFQQEYHRCVRVRYFH